jgi:molybdenum cofactor synthesis domain-containing protein
MTPAPGTEIVTAAILVIGDEILSGRTQDANSHYIAKYLADLGVDLREIRVVPDVADEIVAAVDALRARHTYVFTTGGIGPTHDDITADSIARAFGVGIEEDPRALAMLLEVIPADRLNAARRRMARVPLGAELIENRVSKAPGFMIGNVIVMAGVPIIMHAMLDAVAPKLKTCARVLVETVKAHDIPEGRYAAGLEALAAEHPTVGMGSYPHFGQGKVSNDIVLRSRDAEALAAAAEAVQGLLAHLRADRAPC